MHAGESNGLPLTSWESVNQLEIEGLGPVERAIQGRSITPDYRQALGIPLLRGRDFTEQDVASQRQVALVNQAFASTYLAGRDPIGARIRFSIGNSSGAPWVTVVGIVAKMAHDSLEDRDQPMTFQPVSEGSNFAIACRVPPEQIVAPMRAILHSADPVLTIADVRTMKERMQASNARRTLQTALLTGFSAFAVCLAVAGIYGLMSYLVRQRTREIGLRVALGSSKTSIMRLIVGEALKLVLLGVAIGVCAALVVTGLLTFLALWRKRDRHPHFRARAFGNSARHLPRLYFAGLRGYASRPDRRSPKRIAYWLAMPGACSRDCFVRAILSSKGSCETIIFVATRSN